MAVELINYTDSLKQGTDKINASIELSNEAIEKAIPAFDIANRALTNAANTQTQLDTIVINGDSSVEAAQARVDVSGNVFDTLKERLDTENVQINVKSFGAVGDGLTDDTLFFENALDTIESLGRGVLIIPNGTYLISNSLPIPSNTIILGKGKVIIKRNSDTDNIMITKSDGISGGFDGCENIVIDNIIFDASGSDHQPLCTILASGHAKNITVKNCTFKNLNNWHMIEFNSTKDSIITRCIFDTYGYGSEGVGSEMVQLDFAGSSGAFPWYGPYDNTHCENIKIIDNVFKNCNGDAIGNHSFLSGAILRDIFIENNKFVNVSIYGLSLCDIDGYYIANNKFEGCPYGIYLANQLNNNNDIIIRDNYYYGTRSDTYVTGEGRFVGINPTGRNGFITSGIKIINNIIYNANTHGIAGTFSNVIINNNYISGSYRNGIYIYGGENIVITDNETINNNVSAGSYYDIIIGNNVNDVSSDILVSNNIFGTYATTNYSEKVFITGNISTISLWAGTGGTAKNNMVNGTYTA